ncbi:MAG: hypothetical protein IPJ36_17170 [Simplicispira sp.]|nr:hypothetical protein [Simplicispira sp.]
MDVEVSLGQQLLELAVFAASSSQPPRIGTSMPPCSARHLKVASLKPPLRLYRDRQACLGL